jgi:predicted nucleic acid-binding protein
LFLAWYKRETDKPLGFIRMLLDQIANDRLTLLAPVLCCAEVLNEAGQSDARTQFVGFLERPNVIPANVDIRVAERAAVFRERAIEALNRGEIQKGIRAPDAIIAATAVIYRASVLHSFDPVLLSLSGSEIIDGLKVSVPADPTGQQHINA